MAQRTGINVNGLATGGAGREQRLLDFVRRYKPATMVVMDNFSFAQAVHDAGGGVTKVIFRRYLPEDEEGRIIRNREVANYVNIITANGDPRIWRYAINEQYGDITQLGKFLSDVADELVKRGFKGVVGNFAGGVYPENDVERGAFDQLLYTVSNYSKQDRVYLGFHEYTLGLLPFGVGAWDRARLLNPDMVKPQYWTIPQSYGRINNKLPPFWHILRHQWLDIRCREIGLKPPKKVLTEYGIDYMPDQAPSGIYGTLKSRFGASGFPELRGHRTYRDAWKAYFPNWSYWKTYYEQMMWTEHIMPEDVVGWNLFAWNEYWNDRGFQMSDSDEFLAHLETGIAREPKQRGVGTVEQRAPKPSNAGVGVTTKVISPAVVNLRFEAEGSDIGNVVAGDQVIVYPATLTKVLTKYRWIFIEKPATNESGWVYDGTIFERDVYGTPDVPEPIDPFEGYIRALTPAQRSALKALLTDLVNAL